MSAPTSQANSWAAAATSIASPPTGSGRAKRTSANVALPLPVTTSTSHPASASPARSSEPSTGDTPSGSVTITFAVPPASVTPAPPSSATWRPSLGVEAVGPDAHPRPGHVPPVERDLEQHHLSVDSAVLTADATTGERLGDERWWAGRRRAGRERGAMQRRRTRGRASGSTSVGRVRPEAADHRRRHCVERRVQRERRRCDRVDGDTGGGAVLVVGAALGVVARPAGRRRATGRRGAVRRRARRRGCSPGSGRRGRHRWGTAPRRRHTGRWAASRVVAPVRRRARSARSRTTDAVPFDPLVTSGELTVVEPALTRPSRPESSAPSAAETRWTVSWASNATVRWVSPADRAPTSS